MTLKEFTTITKSKELRPAIVCNDGFTFCAQGGKGFYSNPRDFSAVYITMELSSNPNEILQLQKYRQNINESFDIYPYVPAEEVQQLIDFHGGINLRSTFQPLLTTKLNLNTFVGNKVYFLWREHVNGHSYSPKEDVVYEGTITEICANTVDCIITFEDGNTMQVGEWNIINTK